MPVYLTDHFATTSRQLEPYLPRIAGAMMILLVGWLVAHFISRIVRLGAIKAGLDQRWTGNLGAFRKGGTSSALLGTVAFYLTMLFVMVGFFNTLALPIISEPLNSFLSQILGFAPRLFSACALGLCGWALARAVKETIQRSLEAINIDQKLAGIGEDTAPLTTASRQTHVPRTQPRKPQPRKPHRTRAGDMNDMVTVVEHEDLSGTLASAIERWKHKAAEDQDQPAQVVVSTETIPSVAEPIPNQGVSLAQSLPEAAYWLVLFLFLPAILSALQMNGLLEPIQAMCTKAIGYLPNILGAALIVVIGAFGAKLIRRVVGDLTASCGINRLADKMGGEAAFSERKLSEIMGVVAYVMVLLPVLVAALNALDIDAVTQPASHVLGQIAALIPGLLGAVVVLGISYVLAKITFGIVQDILVGVGFDDWPRKLGFNTVYTRLVETSGQGSPLAVATPSKLAATVASTVVMLFATTQALPLMGLERLAVHLEEFFGFAIQVVLGIAILVLGVYLGRLAASFVRGSGVAQAERMAHIAQAATIIFVGAIGLQRMGLAPSIVNLAFGTLLGGLGLAAAIAFGWGGRDAAKRLIDRYVG